MPLYNYACQDCQHHFEVMRSFSQAEAASPPCEQCGSSHTDRQLGTGVAIFSSGTNRRVISSGCGSCAPKSSSACSGCSSSR